MAEFVPIIHVSEVPAGRSVRVQIDSAYYIVCNDNGSYHVTDCVCPHAGGPLANADVRDGCVVCPVHYWPWDLKTGLADPNMPDLRLNVYPSEVRDHTVYAAISHKHRENAYDLDCRNQ